MAHGVFYGYSFTGEEKRGDLTEELDRDLCGRNVGLRSAIPYAVSINDGAILETFKPFRARTHVRCHACRCPLFHMETTCPNCSFFCPGDHEIMEIRHQTMRRLRLASPSQRAQWAQGSQRAVAMGGPLRPPELRPPELRPKQLPRRTEY